MGKTKTLILGLLLLLITSGCSKPEKPEVISTYPENGTIGVSRDIARCGLYYDEGEECIEITFDKETHPAEGVVYIDPIPIYMDTEERRDAALETYGLLTKIWWADSPTGNSLGDIMFYRFSYPEAYSLEPNTTYFITVKGFSYYGFDSIIYGPIIMDDYTFSFITGN